VARRAALCSLAAGVTALVVMLATRGTAAPIVVPNSLVKIDPRTNRVVDVLRVGREPVSVAAAGNYVWVVNSVDETVTRVDARSGAEETTGGLKGPLNVATEGDRGVWITTGGREQVIRIAPKTLKVETVVQLRHIAFLDAVGGGSLWVTEPAANFKSAGALARVDLATANVEDTYRVGVLPAGVATIGGSAWVGNIADGSLTRVSIEDGGVERVPTGASPVELTTGFGSVWVIVGETSVWRVSPSTRHAEDVIRVGKGPFSIATGADAVWVGFPETGLIKRIDPRTDEIVKTIKLRRHVHGIAVGKDAVWVAVGDRPPQLPF
jgi:streptogramin lyase